VLLYDDDAKRCLFHLEQMDKDAWWFALYPDADLVEDEHFDIVRRGKRVEVVQR
jgi:hypothetical protein